MYVNFAYIAFIRHRNFFNHQIENTLRENFQEHYLTTKYDFMVEYYYEEYGQSQQYMLFTCYNLEQFLEVIYRKQILETQPNYGFSFPEDSKIWIINRVFIQATEYDEKTIVKKFEQDWIDETI